MPTFRKSALYKQKQYSKIYYITNTNIVNLKEKGISVFFDFFYFWDILEVT